MNKYILGLLIIFSGICAREKPLKNRLIEGLDGVPYALDGAAFGDMVHVRSRVRVIQYGMRNHVTKELQGCYEFRGERHSIHSLRKYEDTLNETYTKDLQALDQKHLRHENYEREWGKVEKQLLKEHQEEVEAIKKTKRSKNVVSEEEKIEMTVLENQLKHDFDEECENQKHEIKRKHIDDICQYEQKRKIIEQGYKEKIAELKPILEQAKEEFIEINDPFMEQARGGKHFMLLFIKESCHNRRRYNSFLLQWGKEAEGEEMDAFREYMTSFKKLDTFCTDLINFMEDLIHSCPKGWNQFLKMVKESKQK